MDTKINIKGCIPVKVMDWDALRDMGQKTAAKKPAVKKLEASHIGDMPIEKLVLSNHLFNLFCRYGMKKVSDILSFSDEEWQEKGGIGVKSWPELKKLLDLVRTYTGKNLAKEKPKAQVWEYTVAFDTPLLQVSSLNDQISRHLLKLGLVTMDDLFHCHPKDWQNLQGLNRWRKKDYWEAALAFREDCLHSMERELLHRYEGKLKLHDFHPLLAWTELTSTTYQTVLDLLQQEGYPTSVKAWRDMVCKNAETSKHMERCLLDRLEEEEFDSLTYEELASLFPAGMYREDWLQDTLHRLEEEKKVGRSGARYFRIYSSMYDFIEKETKGKYKYCVLSRLQGVSVDEIAKKMGFTTERVRQFQYRFIARVPLVEEMRYMAQKITWEGLSDDDFAYLFQLPDDTVRFLDYYMDEPPRALAVEDRLERLQQIEQDENQPEDVRKRAALRRNELRPTFLTEEGEILINRQALLRYALHHYAKEGISAKELTDLYNGFIHEKLSAWEKKLHADIHYTEKLALTMETLTSRKRQLRFYDVVAGKYDDLLQALQLEQYKDVEISSLKLFYDHPQLMEAYDIRDHYELHNLLKKLQILDKEKGEHRLPADMVFSRSPTILFGHADRYHQVYDMLKRKGPMTRPELAEEMKKEYGISAINFFGNGWLVAFAKYKKGNVYDLSSR